MLFIYLYCLNTQNNYLEICKYLLSFTYILVIGFKFVYRGGRWRFAVASLCNNLQSMFNQHIRPHHTWDISCLPYFTPLTEHTQQCPGLNEPDHCLLKLVSSRPMCAEAVGGLPTCLSSHNCCPITSSLFLRRASQKSVWNFLPITWRKKDVAFQMVRSNSFLSTSMADGWLSKY
jgi:hypothetical protein